MELKLEFGMKACGLSLYLPEGVKPEKKAVEELRGLMELEKTIERLKSVEGFFEDKDSSVKKVIMTPDFHKGAGIPIGTVMMTEGFAVPQAMGNDINCGMRLYITDLKEEKLLSCLEDYLAEIRRVLKESILKSFPIRTTEFILFLKRQGRKTDGNVSGTRLIMRLILVLPTACF